MGPCLLTPFLICSLLYSLFDSGIIFNNYFVCTIDSLDWDSDLSLPLD